MKDKYVHAAISMNWKSYSMDGDLSNHLLTSDHVSPIPLIGTWQLTMFPFLWPSCKLYCRFALKLCVCLPQLAIFLQEWNGNTSCRKGKPWNIILEIRNFSCQHSCHLFGEQKYFVNTLHISMTWSMNIHVSCLKVPHKDRVGIDC